MNAGEAFLASVTAPVLEVIWQGATGLGQAAWALVRQNFDL